MYYFFSPYYEVALVLALVLLALAAPSQFTARNTGTILYICWVFLGNLISLINKLVWPDHARNIAPVLCDISQCFFFACFHACSFVRSFADRHPPRRTSHPAPHHLAVYFRIGFHFAIEAVCIVINRRLFMLCRISPVIATPAQVSRPSHDQAVWYSQPDSLVGSGAENSSLSSPLASGFLPSVCAWVRAVIEIVSCITLPCSHSPSSRIRRSRSPRPHHPRPGLLSRRV